MKYIIILLFAAAAAYGQNAYTDAQLLTDITVPQLIAAIDNLKTESEYDKSPHKAGIENFYTFLKEPFKQDLLPVDVSNSIKLIAVAKAEIAIAKAAAKGILFDDDRDGVPDAYDACPGVRGTLRNNGCPEAAVETSEAIIPTGQDMTTVIVDALAKFLVDRVKQELTITFFENFREKLDTKLTMTFSVEGKPISITIEMKQLFPNTFLLLDSKDYFDTPSLGKTWVTAFKKDLITLPYQLELILRSNNDFAGTNLGNFALMSFDVISQAKRGEHPIRIIENINSTYNSGKTFSNTAQQAVGLLYLLSSNLTKEVPQDGEKVLSWVTQDDLQKLDGSSKKYLTGLIYQQGRQSKLFDKIMNNGTTLSLTQKITLANYTVFYNDIQQLCVGFRGVVQLLEKVKADVAAQPTERTLEDYANYLSAFYGLLDRNIEMTYRILDGQNFYTSAYFTKIRPIATDIIGFNSALAQKNYAETILLSVSLLKHVCDDNNEVIKTFTYYGNFLADIITVSESGSSDDVKKIIENYAMPVGSYRVKRMYSHSWDVNAFPGLYLGYEFSGSNSVSYGITAPVGIAYSQKHCRDQKFSSATTLFLSVIDIGAPFSYRFENDEAEGLPQDIKWEQIFSPGFFVMHCFSQTPITLSLGGQFSPLLRKIESEGNTLSDKNIFRISLGLMVDIPLFNLKKGKLHY